MTADFPQTRRFADELWSALGGEPGLVNEVAMAGEGVVPGAYPASDFAVASFAVAGTAIAELIGTQGSSRPPVVVDRPLASAWTIGGGATVRFSPALRPIGWRSPPMLPPGSLGGFYPTADERWVHFQLNFPVRPLSADARALFGAEPTPEHVAAVVKTMDADILEHALWNEAGYLVTATHTTEEWARHPQGRAVAAEPLVDVTELGASDDSGWRPTPQRPLAGVRVLDLTRILSGPCSTRLLAGYGAEVLRIDPPGYTDLGGPDGAAGDVQLGKRCARLDLRSDSGREQFLELLASADVLVNGYRPGALDGLGLGTDVRAAARPGLVEVLLDAYGWTGPWARRRGHDSTVQTASGMVFESGRFTGVREPVLGERILDLGTSQVLAAAAIRGLTHRLRTGHGSRLRCSLARTSALIVAAGRPRSVERALPVPFPAEPDPRVFVTPAGPARRLSPPMQVGDAPMFWERPSELPGSSAPVWSGLDSAVRV
jgi:hypothetical protein